MIKLAAVSLAFVAVASGIGSCENGWRDVSRSMTQWSYPEIRDMRRTVGISPQHKVMLTPAEGTVSTTGVGAPQGAEGVELAALLGERLTNPVPADDASVARGEIKYRKNCVPCHGPTLAGEGPVSALFMPPPDLLAEMTRQRADGYIYSYIRNGGVVMPRYGHSVTNQEAWDLVNYVRHMQKTSPR